MNRLELLERRLNRLEKQNRRVKSFLVIACAFAVLPFLLATTQKQEYVTAETVRAETVFANRFTFSGAPFSLALHPPQGVEQGIGIYYGSNLLFYFESSTTNAFNVYNNKGAEVASVFAAEDGGAVEINGNNGKGAAYLFAKAGGGSFQLLNPSSGKVTFRAP